MPGPKEHSRFCQNDEWILYKSNDHDYYQKVLNDGTILRTKVSRGTKEYSKTLFAEILKQLGCNKEYFNSKI